jgi:hypothetical protein
MKHEKNGSQHALISNGGVCAFQALKHASSLVYFDSSVLRNPPHAHSANR